MHDKNKSKLNIKETQTTTSRLTGVDSIRFVMALIVVAGHFGLPKIPGEESQHGLLKIIIASYHSLPNGPAAVIIFFLISGLCIHFPARNSLHIPNIKAFYTRRITRITIPAITALIIGHFLGNTNFYMLGNTWSEPGITWSLVAELIYYLIYPLILTLRRKYSWKTIIITSYIFAIILASTKPLAGNYSSFGNSLNWILGLPCWLLGCLLAEKSDNIKTTSHLLLVLWRILLCISLLMITVLRWHLPGRISIGNPWSLNLFAIVAFFWLRYELAWASKNGVLSWLESAGRWSYSLYLVHLMMIYLSSLLPQSIFLKFIFLYGGSLVLAFLFYLACEQPAQNLAIYLSRRVASKIVVLSLPTKDDSKDAL